MDLRKPIAFCLVACALLAGFGVSPVRAQTPALTVVQGRVFNVAANTYAPNARVVISGTALEAFTNEFGEYRFPTVPVGEITLRASFTGLAEQSATLKLETGVPATANFDLTTPTTSATGKPTEVFELAAFEVRTSSEMAASAVAVNEQRYAPNIKSVVDIGEFGDLGESNVGEFIKFLPSVSIEYNGSVPRTVAVRGLPAAYTPLTIDGNRAASAASGQNSRNTELVGFALNNLARIEVTKTPTSDIGADAIGGSVNLVSRSAFERRRPYSAYHVYGTFNSEDISLNTVHGPSARTSGATVRPGFDFIYQNPVSKKFAFSINGQYFQRLNPEHVFRGEWTPTSARIGTGTEANPYLSRVRLLDGDQDSETASAGLVLDFRPTPKDLLTFATSYVTRDTYTDDQSLEWQAGDNAVSWGPTYTHGSTAGRVGFTNGDYRHKLGETTHNSLNFRHTGTVWKLDTGLFYSRSSNKYRDISEGYFRNFIIRRRDVIVNYDNITNGLPGAISTSTGSAALNPLLLDDLLPEQGSSEESDAVDVIRGGHFDASRVLDFRQPITLKLGVSLREQRRDIDTRSDRWNFRGPDHSGSRPVSGANSELVKDLSARYGVNFATDHYADSPAPFGFPAIQWPSSDKFYEFFRTSSAADPLMWSEDTAFASRDSANRSPVITETVTAGYVRADTKLLNNRLWLVGGVRFENTRDNALGAKEATVGTAITYARRADQRLREYSDFFPSLNLSYEITRNFVGRFAYSRTLGRPNFTELAPGYYIDDDAAPTYRVIVNNPNLKPAYADNYDLSLEYYFNESGVVAAGVFQKDIKDFVNQSIHTATQEEEVLYGVDPLTTNAVDVLMKINIESAKIQGVEFSYKQPLTFLPDWAYGVQVYANATAMKLSGDGVTDFTGFQRRAYNWGVALNRKRFDMKLNWNYTGRQRGLLITGVRVPSETYDYVDSRLLLDANFGIRLTKHVELYGSARNLTKEPLQRLRYSAGTPGYAYPLQYEDYGVQFTLGFRGSF